MENRYSSGQNVKFNHKNKETVKGAARLKSWGCDQLKLRRLCHEHFKCVEVFSNAFPTPKAYRQLRRNRLNHLGRYVRNRPCGKNRKRLAALKSVIELPLRR